MKNLAAMLSAAMLAVAGIARGDGFALGAHIGTLGPGLDAVGYLTPHFDLRAVGNYAAFNVHGTINTTDYNTDITMESLQGLLDWRPTEGNFRITGGVVLNNNRVKLTTQPTDSTIKVGDNEYPSSEVGQMNGDITFSKIAPYFGIGYGNAVAGNVGLTFSFDIGVVYQGQPTVKLTDNGPIAADPTFQSDLAIQQQDAMNTASDYKFYPVISFGICYQF